MKKDDELHESAGVIVEERERAAKTTAKLEEVVRVVEGLKVEVAAKNKALRAKEAELGEAKQALKLKKVELRGEDLGLGISSRPNRGG